MIFTNLNQSVLSVTQIFLTMDFKLNIMCSTIAAFTTRLITHPLDTVKTRIQLQSDGIGKTRSGIIPTIVNLYKTGGIKGIYPGLCISLVFSVPAMATYLTLYDESKKWFDGKPVNPIFVHGFAAIVAESTSGLFW